jgi:hypothetical protein
MIIRPIRSEEEVEECREVALADGSHLYWPTHVIRRYDGEVIGTLSIMPMVFLWAKNEMTARESTEVRDFYEGLLANQSRVVCVPCPKDSAYLETLRKEYTQTGRNYIPAPDEVQLFFKGI